jgi:hypothetical protein
VVRVRVRIRVRVGVRVTVRDEVRIRSLVLARVNFQFNLGRRKWSDERSD